MSACVLECVCTRVCVCMYTCCGSQRGHLQELLFAFHHMGPRLGKLRFKSLVRARPGDTAGDLASIMWEVEAGAGSKREFQEGLTYTVRSCSLWFPRARRVWRSHCQKYDFLEAMGMFMRGCNQHIIRGYKTLCEWMVGRVNPISIKLFKKN